jgi:hypothetical protein
MSGLFDQITNYSPPLLTAGQVNYKGTWDAAANSPTLVSPPAAISKGDYYVVSAAGTQFTISFAVGDWIISNGTAWEKVDLTDAVSSVFGRTGAVVGASTDYSSVGLTNTAIGASSPSTGAFTTVTASSTIAATGAVTGSNLSGTNTGDQTNITGNAATATALQTARAINGVSFDGTAAITVTAAGSTLSDTVTIAKGGTGQITAQAALNALLPSQAGASGKNLQSDGTNVSFVADAGGTVTSVSVSTANGVSGTVATSTTTPAISLTLGAITPTSVAASGSVTGSNLSGTNTGDQTISITGDVTAAGSTGTLTASVTKINGTSLAGLTTGLLKNTTTTGVPTIAVSGTDYAPPTSGTAILYGNNAGGFSNVTVGSGLSFSSGTLASTSAGGSVTSVSVTTANGVSGTVTNPTSTPDISLTLGAITPSSVNSVVLSGSATPTLAVTGTSSISGTSSGTNTGDQTITLTGGVTGSGTGSFAATVVTNANLTGAITSVGNATSLGSFSSANLAAALTDETGSGAAVFATSPTLVTPILGTPSSGTLSSCTGLPISTGVSGLGTGIATALAVNTGSAGAPVLFNGALGTPTSGTVTNLTGTASINTNGAHNGTVGATTPSTVAATTISTTGTVTATANNIKAFVGTTGAGTGFAYGTYESNGGAQYGRVGIEGSSGGTLLSGTGAYDFIVGSISGSTWIGAGGAGIAKISGTGLAVTGALSASSSITASGFTVPTSGTSAELGYSSPNVFLRGYDRTGSAYKNLTLNDNITVVGGSAGQVSMGPLAVTGALSATAGLTTGTAAALALGGSGSNLQVGFLSGTVTSTTDAYVSWAGGSSTPLNPSAVNGSLVLAARNTAGAEVVLAAGNTAICRVASTGLAVTGNVSIADNTLITLGTSGGACNISHSTPGTVRMAFTAGGSERMALSDGGYLGIGTASPAGKIDCVTGSSQPIYFRREDNGGQNVQIYHDAGGGYVAMGGTVAKDLTIKNLNAASINVIAGSNGVYLANAATSWASLSDERTKDIIENITDAATKVLSLRAVIGKYKTDSEGTRRSFLIAQDVQAILPEAVDATNPDKLGLQYSDVIPLLVASIKELTQRVAALESSN